MTGCMCIYALRTSKSNQDPLTLPVRHRTNQCAAIFFIISLHNLDALFKSVIHNITSLQYGSVSFIIDKLSLPFVPD